MANDLAELRRAYRSYVNNLMREMEAATEDAAENLLDRIKELTGLTDHSLDDLRRLGHPYAKRHSLGSGPHPDYEVHNQEGDLQESLRVEHEGVWRGGQIASDIHSDAEHTWHLLQGTDIMRPRDFASAAILQGIGEIESRYRQAFRAAGGEYRDDGDSFIEIDLIEHDRNPAQLPG